ncbi:hypothetical protein ACN28S_65500 [Cystobacter fuscus]
MIQDESTLIHREYVSDRPFEAVVEPSRPWWAPSRILAPGGADGLG